MYFGHCATPAELRKAISDLLPVVTFTSAELRGTTIIPIVGPLEDQTLRQAVLEVLSTAQRLRKESPELPPVPDTTCLPLEGLMRLSAWCEKVDWKTGLHPDEIDFLLMIGRKVEILVAGPAGSKAMERFRSQLGHFGERWKEYRRAHDAYENGTWNGEMGEPINPLGAIWPWVYRTGWTQCEDQKPSGRGVLMPMSPHEALIRKDIPELLADYVLLAAVHDMVLAGCARINDGCLPDELAREIRGNILDDPQREGGLSSASHLAGNKKKLEDALVNVERDLKPQTEHGSREKADSTTDGLGQPGMRSLVSGEMNEMEIRQVREYADRVAELLEPTVIPSLEPRWKSESPGLNEQLRAAVVMAHAWDEVLHPLRVKYREKVVAILGDSSWEPIAEIFEHYAAQAIGKLGGWRQDILDHTDPGSNKTSYWLECQNRAFGPNPDLKNRIENIVGKLRRRADRAEQALSREEAEVRERERGTSKPDIPGLIERLKALRSALDSGDKELARRARNALKAYAGSAERLYDALQEPLRGSTAYALERLKWVGDARKNRSNTGLYNQLLDELATPEFIAELERWLRQGGIPTDYARDETYNAFEEGSGFWTVTFRGKKLPAMQGREAFAYLAYILTHPGEWISAMCVMEAAHEAESARQRRPLETPDQEDAGEEESRSRKKGIKHQDGENTADRKYLRECHERLSHLRAELERAQNNRDTATAAACQQEIDSITSELRQLIRPGGRLQKFTTEVDRAYTCIQKARSRVLEKVAGHSPELLQHLENCIHFDKPCISYQPETPTEWHWATPQKE